MKWSLSNVVRFDQFLTTPGNIARLKAGLKHVKIIKTDEDFAPYLELLKQDKFPSSLHRETAGKILDLVAGAIAEEPVPLRLRLEFAQDHSLCEWIYVVDLDAEKLEVYSNARAGSTGEAEARFAEIGGCHLGFVKGYGLKDLPKSEEQYVKELDPGSGERQMTVQCPVV